MVLYKSERCNKIKEVVKKVGNSFLYEVKEKIMAEILDYTGDTERM